MKPSQLKQIRDEFIGGMSNYEWSLIADALFDKQCELREECRLKNCSDREWQLVDDTYSLYMNLATFVLDKKS